MPVLHKKVNVFGKLRRVKEKLEIVRNVKGKRKFREKGKQLEALQFPTIKIIKADVLKIFIKVHKRRKGLRLNEVTVNL